MNDDIVMREQLSAMVDGEPLVRLDKVGAERLVAEVTR